MLSSGAGTVGQSVWPLLDDLLIVGDAVVAAAGLRFQIFVGRLVVPGGELPLEDVGERRVGHGEPSVRVEGDAIQDVVYPRL